MKTVRLIRAHALRVMTTTQHRLTAARHRGDRGDVPGWVLITLMTAGLVTALWGVAGTELKSMFVTAIHSVSGGTR